ncbi:MAG TPA: hypothetical protein VGK67_14245 [Myxococcales bacterium]|jgi:hypothetical protein
MKTRSTTVGIAAAAGLMLLGAGAWGQMEGGQGRVVSYEGHLDLAGQPQSGSFDFRFAFFAAEADDAGCLGVEPLDCAGALWAEALPAVAVNRGTFAVALGERSPIGDAVLANPDLYLAIAVRRGADAFTVLQGKQRLLGVPLAVRAASAGAKDFNASGNVTVGGTLTSGAASVTSDKSGAFKSLRFGATGKKVGHIFTCIRDNAAVGSYVLMVNGATNPGRMTSPTGIVGKCEGDGTDQAGALVLYDPKNHCVPVLLQNWTCDSTRFMILKAGDTSPIGRTYDYGGFYTEQSPSLLPDGTTNCSWQNYTRSQQGNDNGAMSLKVLYFCE